MVEEALIAYRIVGMLGVGHVLVIAHPVYGEQCWIAARKFNRVDQVCRMCGEQFPANTAYLWRPITNGRNRGNRICYTCISKWNKAQIAAYDAAQQQGGAP